MFVVDALNIEACYFNVGHFYYLLNLSCQFDLFSLMSSVRVCIDVVGHPVERCPMEFNVLNYEYCLYNMRDISYLY